MTMTVKIEKRQTLWGTTLLAILIATAVFGFLYGYRVLNPFKDSWIVLGYDEMDIPQHYAGWCAFQNSAWHFPLGFADTMADGSYITYTDSIPWVAILCKAVLQCIGYTGTFQYFGLYVLLCYILQAWAAGLLVRRKTDSLWMQALSMTLLCFSPVLMERAFRHTALASQWMILLAIYAFLRCRDNGFCRYPRLFYLLALLAVGIHPYFLPLTMIFALVTTVYGMLYTRRILYFGGAFAGNLAACLLAGIGIGAINFADSLSREGYGYYGMNLNAPFNPVSIGGYTWSALFAARPQINGNYDGFNYFGAGVMLLAVFCLIALLWQHKLTAVLKRNAVYLVAMAWMAAFAITNIITLDACEFVIPLPEGIVSLFGVFRASSRMFYAVFYSGVVFGLTYLCAWRKSLKTNVATNNSGGGWLVAALAIVVAVQLYDLHSVIYEKHIGMQNKLQSETILDDTALQEKMREYECFTPEDEWRDLAVLALKNDLKTLYTVDSNGGAIHPKASAEKAQKWADLEQGNADPYTVFETSDGDKAARLAAINPGLEIYESYGHYFLFPAQA